MCGEATSWRQTCFVSFGIKLPFSCTGSPVHFWRTRTTVGMVELLLKSFRTSFFLVLVKVSQFSLLKHQQLAFLFSHAIRQKNKWMTRHDTISDPLPFHSLAFFTSNERMKFLASTISNTESVHVLVNSQSNLVEIKLWWRCKKNVNFYGGWLWQTESSIVLGLVHVWLLFKCHFQWLEDGVLCFMYCMACTHVTSSHQLSMLSNAQFSYHFHISASVLCTIAMLLSLE